MSSDHQQLFSDYAAGTISAEDFRRLNAALEKDQTLQTAFLEYMNTCAFLEDAASYSESLYPGTEIDFESAGEKPVTVRIRAFPVWTTAAAVAACIVLGFLVWSYQPSAPGLTVTTKVLASFGVQAQNSAQSFTVGDELMLSQIELTEGWVRLELPRGVVVDIYGPAKGHFENNTRFHLDSGRLNVDVGPHGKGFTVITANAEIVDLGTQFGIDVDQGADAKVAVFSGEVEVHSANRQTSPRLLVEGEGVHLRSSGLSSRLMSIDIPDEPDATGTRFTRSHQFEIRDNLTTENNLRYYGIIKGGMREGANVYTTQSTVRWLSPQNQRFPAELAGADLIQTFNNDRNEYRLKIDLRVKEASNVFVMFDERYGPPLWLQENFSDTGHTLLSGPWKPVAIVHDILPDSQGDFFVRYRVWKAELEENQTVQLGDPVKSQSREDLRAMYGIAIKTKRPAPFGPIALPQN